MTANTLKPLAIALLLGIVPLSMSSAYAANNWCLKDAIGKTGAFLYFLISTLNQREK